MRFTASRRRACWCGEVHCRGCELSACLVCGGVRNQHLEGCKRGVKPWAKHPCERCIGDLCPGYAGKSKTLLG